MVELGVGTGRIAIPIAADGIQVIGVDSSEGMLDVARERAALAGRRASTCAYGDFRDPPVEGPVPLVTIPFRSLLHMQTDDDRRAVAARRPRGCSSRAGASSSTSSRPAPTTSPRRTAAGSSASPGIFERADWDEAAPHADPARPRRRRRVGARRSPGSRSPSGASCSASEGFVVEGLYGWFDGTPWAGHEDSIWVCRRRD